MGCGFVQVAEGCPDAGQRHPASSNILDRAFEASAPSQKWIVDFTYSHGAAHRQADDASGVEVDDGRHIEPASAALIMAIWRRGKHDSLLHHSDEGGQPGAMTLDHRLSQPRGVRGCSYVSLISRVHQTGSSSTGQSLRQCQGRRFMKTLKVEAVYVSSLVEVFWGVSMPTRFSMMVKVWNTPSSCTWVGSVLIRGEFSA
jgi:transposase InsO family protein